MSNSRSSGDPVLLEKYIRIGLIWVIMYAISDMRELACLKEERPY